MENVYKNFYRNFYKKTNGFIPASPLNDVVHPGDFFQIRNGQMLVLGNIFRNNVIDPQDAEIGYGNKLNPASWNFSDGITKPYSGRGSGHGALAGEFEFSKQVLDFASGGSFMFKAQDPESVRILNWNEIQQALIIRLTQTYYSFREVYIVTETATAADWTLAISSTGQAELEIVTDTENFGLVDIFGHSSSKTVQSKNIEYYHREHKRRPSFYKAKKLAVREEKIESLTADLIASQGKPDEWARDFYKYDFDDEQVSYRSYTGISSINTIDLLSANELNPNTALLYFKWVEANLDDVEKLFLSDGR